MQSSNLICQRWCHTTINILLASFVWRMIMIYFYEKIRCISLSKRCSKHTRVWIRVLFMISISFLIKKNCKKIFINMVSYKYRWWDDGSIFIGIEIVHPIYNRLLLLSLLFAPFLRIVELLLTFALIQFFMNFPICYFYFHPENVISQRIHIITGRVTEPPFRIHIGFENFYFLF